MSRLAQLPFDALNTALKAAGEETRLRILVLVAEAELTVSDLKQILRQSQPRISRHLKLMVEAGLIETVRGRRGGIKLGRPAEDITLLDTIKLTEENFAMAECFEGGDVSCPLVDNCDVNSALREALGAFFNVLDSYTIADLASKRRSLRDRLGLRFEDMEPVLIAETAH